MKAPDKIYIQIDKPTGAMFVNYDKNDEANIDYIRKDAIVDKLYKWFEEDTTVADYYSKEAFEWAVATGLIQGNENGMLDVNGLADKDQLAAMTTRFVNMM